MLQRSVRSIVPVAAVVLSTAMNLMFFQSARAEPGTQSVLSDANGQAKGYVVIAPDARDPNGVFHAEVTVNIHGLDPNTTYQVWRAIDFVPDGFYDPGAPGTGFAEIATISTSAGGAGAMHLVRGGTLVSGDEFDLLIQVRLDDGTTLALESDVMTVTVK